MKIYAAIDRFIKEVYENGEYGYIFKNLTVMDVGCNVGTFSLWIQPLAKQVYALDISKENIDNLNSSIDENLIRNIRSFNCGISGKTGVRTINEAGQACSGGWRLGEGELTVDTYTINDFMCQQKIDHVDILKIDTEGAEIEILSAPDFPKGKISTICGEIHYNQVGHARDEVKPILEKLGYRYFEFPNNHFVGRL